MVHGRASAMGGAVRLGLKCLLGVRPVPRMAFYNALLNR